MITLSHLKWFLFTFLGRLTEHTQERDAREVGDVYNRGNDFFAWFLGKSMVYTSGIFTRRATRTSRWSGRSSAKSTRSLTRCP